MRLFIGIPLENEVKDYLETLTKETLSHAVSYQEQSKDNLHVYLLFLGEMLITDVYLLNRALEFLKKEQKFELTLSKLNYFQKDLFGVGLKGDMKQLELLFTKIKNAVNSLGFKYKESLSAHIALAKDVKFEEGFEYKKVQVKPLSIKIDKVHLYESIKSNNKVIYEPLTTLKLK